MLPLITKKDALMNVFLPRDDKFSLRNTNRLLFIDGNVNFGEAKAVQCSYDPKYTRSTLPDQEVLFPTKQELNNSKSSFLSPLQSLKNLFLA